MHVITGCDIVSYPYGKGKISALKVLLEGNFIELSDVLGEEHATDDELLSLGQIFFAALYGQPEGTTMNDARHNIYIKKKGKLMQIMCLPPTDKNLLHHLKRAQLAVMLGKAANQTKPPDIELTDYSWTFKGDIPMPLFAADSPAPPELLNVLSCSCKAQGKACSTANCTCHKNQIPCTSYCNCEGLELCLNPYSNKDIGISNEPFSDRNFDEEENEYEDEIF